jgi:hypothetical protein
VMDYDHGSRRAPLISVKTPLLPRTSLLECDCKTLTRGFEVPMFLWMKNVCLMFVVCY